MECLVRSRVGEREQPRNFWYETRPITHKKLYPMISEVDIGMDKEMILQGYFSS